MSTYYLFVWGSLSRTGVTNEDKKQSACLEKPRLVAELFFRPFGAYLFPTTAPRLAPWAVLFRRFAAKVLQLLPLVPIVLEFRNRLKRETRGRRLSNQPIHSNFICLMSAIKRGSFRRLFHFGSTFKKVIRTSLAAKPISSRDRATSVSPRAL